MRRRRTWTLAALVGACGAAAAGALAAGAPDIPSGGDLHEGVGQADTRPLVHSLDYQASGFPVTLGIRPIDDRWEGIQLRSGPFRFVQLHHLRTGAAPLQGVGFVTIEASTGPTSSPPKVAQRLHATPGLRTTPIRPATAAGYPGKVFDATVVGTDRPKPRGISLAPFTVNRHCGFCTKTMHGETGDVKFAGTGQVLRIYVLGAQNKTIVIYIESAYADQPQFPPAKAFPAFLQDAELLVANLEIS